MLNFLEQRLIPGVEAIERGCYRRTISLDGVSGTVCVAYVEGDSAVQVGISFPEPRWLFLIVERVRRMFDLAADPCEISAHLNSDDLLSSLIKTRPGLRVPACWDAFELAVGAVLDHQFGENANTFAASLAESFGTPTKREGRLTHLFPTSNDLAQADLKRIDLPEKCAETIRSLAQAVRDGQICFSLASDPDQFRSRLRKIPGIGNWTAQYIAMRALGDPDAFPSDDPNLLRSAFLSGERELIERAEGWRPWRAYAAMYLWQAHRQFEEMSTVLETTRLPIHMQHSAEFSIETGV